MILKEDIELLLRNHTRQVTADTLGITLGSLRHRMRKFYITKKPTRNKDSYNKELLALGSSFVLLEEFTKVGDHLSHKCTKCSLVANRRPQDILRTPICSACSPTVTKSITPLPTMLSKLPSEFKYITGYAGLSTKCKMQHECGYVWEVMPTRLLNKESGCPKCAGLVRIDFKEFISRTLLAHGTRYTYDENSYVGWKHHVTVLCSEHGPFNPKAEDHVSKGSNCPKCAGKLHNVIYFWNLEGTSLYKIGITTSSSKLRRIQEIASAHNTSYNILVYKEVDNPSHIEKYIKDTWKDKLAGIKGPGSTEIFDLELADVSVILKSIEEYQ